MDEANTRPDAGAPMTDAERTYQLELARLALDRTRFRAETLKWLIVALGAVISFLVIDYGRLRLEQFRATTENERALLNAYLDASDALQPDVWVRKLQVIRTLSTAPDLRGWADGELLYIGRCAAKEAVYRDTLRTAAALLHPAGADQTERRAARQRFEQLYWADLPYVKESPEVVSAMIGFRNALIKAEAAGADGAGETPGLNGAMIKLANALRADDPRENSACGRPAAR